MICFCYSIGDIAERATISFKQKICMEPLEPLNGTLMLEIEIYFVYDVTLIGVRRRASVKYVYDNPA